MRCRPACKVLQFVSWLHVVRVYCRHGRNCLVAMADQAPRPTQSGPGCYGLAALQPPCSRPPSSLPLSVIAAAAAAVTAVAAAAAAAAAAAGRAQASGLWVVAVVQPLALRMQPRLLLAACARWINCLRGAAVSSQSPASPSTGSAQILPAQPRWALAQQGTRQQASFHFELYVRRSSPMHPGSCVPCAPGICNCQTRCCAVVRHHFRRVLLFGCSLNRHAEKCKLHSWHTPMAACGAPRVAAASPH